MFQNPFLNTRGSALQISANHVFKNKKFSLKKTFKKPFFLKTILNISMKFFCRFFFGYQRDVPQPIWGMRNFRGSRPTGLGGDRECTDNT
jgi:hypothetical protein